MKFKMLIIILITFFVACKSSNKITACQELKNKKSLNINNYNELLHFDIEDNREVSMLILDGRVASKDILNRIVFNQNDVGIIEVNAVISSDGSELDGEPKRTLIITSSLCVDW